MGSVKLRLFCAEFNERMIDIKDISDAYEIAM